MDVESAPTQPERKEGEEDARPQGEAQGALATAYAFAPHEDAYVRDTFAPVVPPLALGAIAFAIVGLIIWAGIRMTQTAAARKRLYAGYEPRDGGPRHRASGDRRTAHDGACADADPDRLRARAACQSGTGDRTLSG